MMAATTVTGSAYGFNNGNNSGGDDSGCGDGNGDIDRGSGGDGDTNGSSGGNGCSDGGSFGDSESDGRDGDSDGISRGDGNSNGSGNSGNNGITVSLIPFLADCCISPTAITVAANRHRDHDRPCHCPRSCHRTALALTLATATCHLPLLPSSPQPPP
jgi:hypothetical protein